MQISDSMTHVDGGSAEAAATEHPVGEVRLGGGGALGLRSRLLRSSDHDAGYSYDAPWPTGTITLG
ncbi:hypothetical protein ACGFMM_23780 [Streptomyces sp. NPDC048604]|uniref:hypothetical protein n=1 Tax=Streptomyces sp. NPDC048604 TaxID=3365578 RepID=UPI00371DAE1D